MQKEKLIKILRVRIDKTTLKKATNITLKWAKESKQRHITTPNPEILLKSQENHKFRRILNNSDLNTADGIGLIWAYKYKNITKNSSSKLYRLIKWIISLLIFPFQKRSYKRLKRVTGTDLMREICKKSTKKHKIFLLGASTGIAKLVKEKFEKNFPNLNIVGTYSGSSSPNEDKRNCKIINKTKANILFVAYGAPAQEFWINRNLKNLTSIKVAIGIGGAFDFHAEKIKRAPKWMRKTGLEWLFRLIKQPKRIKRIYNATIKFPIKILKDS